MKRLHFDLEFEFNEDPFKQIDETSQNGANSQERQVFKALKFDPGDYTL